MTSNVSRNKYRTGIPPLPSFLPGTVRVPERGREREGRKGTFGFQRNERARTTNCLSEKRVRQSGFKAWYRYRYLVDLFTCSTCHVSDHYFSIIHSIDAFFWWWGD